jgi:DNA-binding CsgD family transcriptional regulator
VSLEDASEPRLTRREKGIPRLVARGYTYREITDMLVVGSGVVRTHVQHIFTKLQLRRRSDLVRWYVTHKDDRKDDVDRHPSRSSGPPSHRAELVTGVSAIARRR